MNYYPEPIRRLIRSFSKLPGIGEKTAERLTMHVLKAPRFEAEHLARHLIDMKEKIRLCSVCFGLSEGETCALCSDSGRDHTLICVVEQPADMIAIEKSGAYRGVYHILQGALSPIDGIGPDNLRIAELLQRIRTQQVAELILATSTSVEGESTAAYLKEILQGAAIRITRIASGVPMGGDLKYVDQVTLKRAMDSRHAI
ncbi:recombination mediator RecR [Desulfatirhabdium butyrativorans]|uniref:recombination mediator RecR n=1 Tax=Desulfatirhabdium butyrativorans TaxID=340467 RepID=UPI00040BB0B9|nr:recombination mediator RecR [Desulfatirhabdium butyrativorans]